MKRITYLLFSIILFACGTTPKKIDGELVNPKKPIIGPEYFNFDEITHYSIEIKEEDAVKYLDSLSNLNKSTLLGSVIIDNKPESLTDTIFINSLESPNFKKTEIESKLFEDFKNIFREKIFENIIGTMCLPVYRDILIFKKNKKIVGIAKICFHCGHNYIVGTKAKTDYFGHGGDYEKLSKLLNKKQEPESTQ